MGAWLPLAALNLDLLPMALQHAGQQHNELPPSLLEAGGQAISSRTQRSANGALQSAQVE
jgi:hypothetical protein